MKWKLTEFTSIRAFFQFEFLIAASILFRVLNSSSGFWLSKESYEHHKSDLSKDIEREETIGTHSLSDDMNRTTKQSGMEVFQKTKKCNTEPSNPTSKYLAKRIRSEVSRSCLYSRIQDSLVLNGQERTSSKHLLSGIQLSKKCGILRQCLMKEENLVTLYSTDELQGCLPCEIRQPQKDEHWYSMYTRHLKIRVQRNKAERRLPGAELCLLKETLSQFR